MSTVVVALLDAPLSHGVAPVRSVIAIVEATVEPLLVKVVPDPADAPIVVLSLIFSPPVPLASIVRSSLLPVVISVVTPLNVYVPVPVIPPPSAIVNTAVALSLKTAMLPVLVLLLTLNASP